MKLRRVLEYLNRTLDRSLTIGANNMQVMGFFIDTSHAVHEDMRSHTGGCVILDRGEILSKYMKQRLNTKSLTYSEFVGIIEYITTIIYAKLFLESQGYEIQKCNVYQDNESAIKLEINGRSYSSQRTRHLEIRYFFVKDRVDQGEMDILYCPTEKMIADFFTKSTQGSLFKKLSAVFMGEIDIATFNNNHCFPLEELVEN